MHTIRKGKYLLSIMRGGNGLKSMFLSSLMVMSLFLSGCVAFDSTVNPRQKVLTEGPRQKVATEGLNEKY